MRKIIMICDRCQKEYIKSGESELIIVSEFCGGFDLCPQCESNLKEWMKNKGANDE